MHEINYVGLELTNNCNMHCNFCFSHNASRAKGFMDMNLYRKIMDEINNISSIEVIGLYLGGESLLHPNIIEILRSLKSINNRSYGTVLSTNGTILTEKLMVEIIKAQITRLNLSISAGCNDLKTKAMKMKQLRTGKYPILTANVVINDQSKEEINKLVYPWIEIVDEVRLNAQIDNQQRYVNRDHLRNIYNGIKNDVNDNVHCTEPFKYIGILWNGDIIPCGCDMEGHNKMGNANSETLNEIFNNDKFNTLRTQLITGTLPTDSICQSCDIGIKNISLTIKK